MHWIRTGQGRALNNVTISNSQSETKWYIIHKTIGYMLPVCDKKGEKHMKVQLDLDTFCTENIIWLSLVKFIKQIITFKKCVGNPDFGIQRYWDKT